MRDHATTSEAADDVSAHGEVAARARRYSSIAILLHWLIAAFVLSTIPLGLFGASSGPPASPPAANINKGFTAESAASTSQSAAPRPPPPAPKSAAAQAATNLHKTVGVVILFLTVLRVGWRLTHKPPALPESMARPLRWIAKTSHALFYLLLIAMPVSGWWMSSAVPSAKRHAFGFGIVDIPFLPVPQGWAFAASAKFVHTNLAWLMIGLALLHIFAALKHHFVGKEDILQRMLPQKSS